MIQECCSCPALLLTFSTQSRLFPLSLILGLTNSVSNSLGFFVSIDNRKYLYKILYPMKEVIADAQRLREVRANLEAIHKIQQIEKQMSDAWEVEDREKYTPCAEPRMRLLAEVSESSKTYHKKVETMTYPLNINRENTAKAIGQAIRHAKRVVVRNHIKADRMERVNQFVVSLRTKLLSNVDKITFASELVGDLCDKTLWYDIGELGPRATRSNYNHNKMALTSIQDLLDMAKRMSHQADAQSEEILGDLEELERELHGLQVLNDDADRINAEGEKLMEDLCLVFSDN
jgi:hypothetical protein